MKYISLFFKISISLYVVELAYDIFFQKVGIALIHIFVDSYERLWVYILSTLIVLIYIYIKNIRNETKHTK